MGLAGLRSVLRSTDSSHQRPRERPCPPLSGLLSGVDQAAEQTAWTRAEPPLILGPTQNSLLFRPLGNGPGVTHPMRRRLPPKLDETHKASGLFSGGQVVRRMQDGVSWHAPHHRIARRLAAIPFRPL